MPTKDPDRRREQTRIRVARHRANKRAAQGKAAPAKRGGKKAEPKPKAQVLSLVPGAKGKKKAPASKRGGQGDTAYEHLSGAALLDAIRREELTTKALENRKEEGRLVERQEVESVMSALMAENVQAFETLAAGIRALVPPELGDTVAEMVTAKRVALGERLAELWQ